MGALKSALTAIFNANNYTSATSGIASKKIPVNESNGLPSGQIGMSDLASVLGDNFLYYTSSEPIPDCNNAPFGLSLTTATTQNSPAVATMILVTYGNSGGHRVQLCLRATGMLFYRGYAGGWSSWKQVQMTDV